MFKKYKIGKVVSITFLFSVILITILYSFDRYVNKKLESQLVTAINDISDQNIKLIQNVINARFNLLNSIAKEFSDYTEEDFANSHEYTEKVAERFGFRELGLALPNGITYMSSNTIFDISHREYFKHSMNGENYVTETLEDMGDKTDINVYSVPITSSNGEIKGVFFAVYDTQEFVDLLQVSSFSGNGYSYIIDSEGNVITDSPIIERGYDKNLFDALINESETSKIKEINNKAIEDIQNGINNNTSGYTKYDYKVYKYAVYSPLNINRWFLITVVPVDILTERILPINNIIQIVSVAIFISALSTVLYFMSKQIKEKDYLQKISYIDSFTGLYNKKYLKEKLLDKKINNKEYKLSLVIYNIENFKVINEVYGVNTGDYLIKEISKVLIKNKKYDKEIIARGYADEFAAIYFYKNKKELETRLNKVINDSKLINYSNKVFNSLYIGIYEIKEEECNFEKIYNHANIAKNKNKLLKTEPFTYYDEILAANETNEKKLQEAIKEGILKKEFKASFKPRFDCKTKKITGCEALGRLHKSNGEIYFPSEFFDISDKTGFTRQIEELIFEDICIKINQWQKKDVEIVPVSINIYRGYLNNMDDFYNLKRILIKYNISPKYIQFEINESSLLTNDKELRDIINKMRSYGFKVLLRDFGVGYLSFSSMRDFKFDILKMDRSFVDKIGDKKGEYIVKEIINLAHNLDMKVIVEGVKTKEQFEFLKENKCNEIQGDYFSEPLDCETFENLLMKKNI